MTRQQAALRPAREHLGGFFASCFANTLLNPRQTLCRHLVPENREAGRRHRPSVLSFPERLTKPQFLGSQLYMVEQSAGGKGRGWDENPAFFIPNLPA